MKEVLTKSFWVGVRKTFRDALEGASADDIPSRADATPGTETSSPPEGGPDADPPSTAPNPKTHLRD